MRKQLKIYDLAWKMKLRMLWSAVSQCDLIRGTSDMLGVLINYFTTIQAELAAISVYC